jgi:hypothetical protein
MADEEPQRSIACHECDLPIKTTTVPDGCYAQRAHYDPVLYQPKSNSVEKGMALAFADLILYQTTRLIRLPPIELERILQSVRPRWFSNENTTNHDSLRGPFHHRRINDHSLSFPIPVYRGPRLLPDARTQPDRAFFVLRPMADAPLERNGYSHYLGNHFIADAVFRT